MLPKKLEKNQERFKNDIKLPLRQVESYPGKFHFPIKSHAVCPSGTLGTSEIYWILNLVRYIPIYESTKAVIDQSEQPN